MSQNLLFCIFGVLIGWVWAHKTVATECERIGKFYVGENVYHCRLITKKGAQE